MIGSRYRLKHVAAITISNVDKLTVEGQVPVRLCNYTDVYYHDRITNGLEFMHASAPIDQARKFALFVGDVVITKDSETANDIGVPAFVSEPLDSVVCGYHLAIIRPQAKLLDPRFLYWSMASGATRSQLSVAATGVTRFGLRSESIGEVTLNVPTLVQQRLIADFLDAETARIDALVVSKLRMAALLEEQLAARVEEVVWRGVLPIPLKYRTEPWRAIMYGIVLPGPDVAPSGVPIVKGGDVTPMRLHPDLLARTTHEIEAPYARSRLQGGDLVFAIRGGIGDVAMVPPELEGANITQDVARVAPGPGVSPEWLLLVLVSHSLQKQVGSRTTGATIKGLNIWDLKRVRVPDSDQARQCRDLDELRDVVQRCFHGEATLRRQIELLQEHRQAIVTAAVTGEIDAMKVA